MTFTTLEKGAIFEINSVTAIQGLFYPSLARTDAMRTYPKTTPALQIPKSRKCYADGNYSKSIAIFDTLMLGTHHRDATALHKSKIVRIYLHSACYWKRNQPPQRWSVTKNFIFVGVLRQVISNFTTYPSGYVFRLRPLKKVFHAKLLIVHVLEFVN